MPLLEMSLEDVLAPATTWLGTQSFTTRAAARHMVLQGSGTILTCGVSPD